MAELLNRGHKTRVNEVSEQDCTLLYIATHRGHLQIANLLLAAGADVSIKCEEDKTALHAAATGEIVEALVSHGAGVNDLSFQDQTPLHFAAQDSGPDVIEALLRHGANLYAVNANGINALLYAVYVDRIENVSSLIQAGADVNLPETEMGSAPIHVASGSGYQAVLQLLLSNGADVSALTDGGGSALHAACCRLEERCCDDDSFPEIVKMLVAHGADVNAHVSDVSQQDTPLMMAVCGDNLDIVLALLSCGANVAATDEQGCTALHQAACAQAIVARFGGEVESDAEASPETLKVLIEHGTDVHARTEDGVTPLHLAALGKRIDKLQMLLSHGGNVEAQDSDGTTPLHMACVNDGFDATPSGQLLTRDKPPGPECGDVVRLLLFHGADPNSANAEGEVPLHQAVFFSTSGLKAEALLAHGADACAKDLKGQILILHTAAQWGHPRVVDLLLSHGANQNTMFKGKNALQFAVEGQLLEAVKRSLPQAEASASSSDETNSMVSCVALPLDTELTRFAAMVSMLLSHGFDLKEACDKGMTPLHIAAERAHPELVEILLSSGASVHSTDAQGCKPLHTAAATEKAESVRLLLTYGADVGAIDKQGRTALHHAAAASSTAKVRITHNKDMMAIVLQPEGFKPLQVSFKCVNNAECVEMLLKQGADASAKDHAGVTPLQAAEDGGPDQVLVLLGGNKRHADGITT